jgi:hypothetical protein
MKYRPPTIQNQLPNTERYNIHPKHNEGTKTQLTTSTKNFISIKSHWKEDTKNKPRAIQSTNDLKERIYNTQKTLPLWRPAGNVDPLFAISKLKNFRKVSKNTHKSIMAEEMQPTKRHKPSDTYTQHDLPQGSPVGEDLDSQILISAGEEEN